MGEESNKQPRRRGRPRVLWPGPHMSQLLLAVFYFHRARKQGLDYNSAVDSAASCMRSSATQVKRFLALSHRGRIGYIVIKEPPEEEIIRGEGVVEYVIGEIPTYPRPKRRRRK